MSRSTTQLGMALAAMAASDGPLFEHEAEVLELAALSLLGDLAGDGWYPGDLVGLAELATTWKGHRRDIGFIEARRNEEVALGFSRYEALAMSRWFEPRFSRFFREYMSTVGLADNLELHRRLAYLRLIFVAMIARRPELVRRACLFCREDKTLPPPGQAVLELLKRATLANT